MFTPLSPSDYMVDVPFRWRGILYEPGSGLPAGMPQGAMTQFLHRSPPLIKLIAEAPTNGTNGTTQKKTSRKKAKKKAKKKSAKR